MITKEEYALAKRANALLFQGTRDDDILSQDLIELIESLRNMARAAETAWPHIFSHMPAKFTKERRAYEALYSTLCAVPKWVLEE